jgi:hypothetical protein
MIPPERPKIWKSVPKSKALAACMKTDPIERTMDFTYIEAISPFSSLSGLFIILIQNVRLDSTMADLIKPWQDAHYMHLSKIVECTVTAIGKDNSGIHTLMVALVVNKQRLPHKVITRTDEFPEGIPIGYVNVGHVLEVFYRSIDDSERIPTIYPVEILNMTHEGGDIIHFKTKKVYDSAMKTRDFDPWKEYLKDMEALKKLEGG